jgi:phage gpG-like protein
MIELQSISVQDARHFLRDADVKWDMPADFAVAVKGKRLHGVILMRADGVECSLAHLYTDGTALVGSLLYGAAWRAAKALGYKQITI